MELAVAEAREQSRSAAELRIHEALAQARDDAAAAAARAAARIGDLEQQLQQADADRGTLRAEQERTSADLAAMQAAAAAEAQRAAASVAKLSAELQNAESARRAQHDELAEALADARAQFAREIERAKREAADLDAALRQAIADRDNAREEIERALAAARESSAAEQEQRGQRALESLRAEHAEVLADRARVGELVEELAAELRRVAMEHDAARAQMERTLVEARAEATRQHDRDRQALADAETRYAQAIAEQAELLQTIAREQSERRRLEADRGALRAELERHEAADRERALVVRDRERSELVANLQAEVALATADQKRLQMLLARAEADQQRQTASHAAERAELQRTLGEATLRRNQIAKQLADERVELKQWRDAACELEPMAAAGRLAIQLARELHDLVASVDERTRLLLDVSHLDASYRPIVETLRADALRTAFLARRLAHADPDAPAHGETP
jgi:hypothetical protein